MENNNATGVVGLPGIIDLMRQSWEILQNHWKNLIRFPILSGLLTYGGGLILGIGTFASVLGIFASSTLLVALFFGIALLIGIILMIYLSVWIYTALFEALILIRKENLDIDLKKAFQISRSRIDKLFFVGFLIGLSVLGGVILLVIPGIVFFIWFCFGSYVYMNEGISGTAALRQSKKYVSGKWWEIFIRVVGCAFLLFLGSAILSGIVGGIFGHAGFLGTLLLVIIKIILNAFFSLFILIYGQILYEAVRGNQIAIV